MSERIDKALAQFPNPEATWAMEALQQAIAGSLNDEWDKLWDSGKDYSNLSYQEGFLDGLDRAIRIATNEE